MFVLYLIGYFFGVLGLFNSFKNDSICCLIGNCFWLLDSHNGVLVLTSPTICNLLPGKWSASSDSRKFIKKPTSTLFKWLGKSLVIQQICSKHSLATSRNNSDVQILLSLRPARKTWSSFDSVSNYASKQSENLK